VVSCNSRVVIDGAGGHSRQVYAVAFHPDGSLAGSDGLDAFGEQGVWMVVTAVQQEWPKSQLCFL
jgi:hypothetical protein